MNWPYQKTIPFFLLITALALLQACSDDFVPKPRGYFRISLPERKYVLLDSVFPYSFEYPAYGIITPDPLAPQEKNWINIELPGFKGSIHLSYKEITGKQVFGQLVEDSRELAMKHIPKASSIEQVPVEDPENKVFGLVYNIKGVGAASPYQFYVTDSTRHFMRGALYFNTLPNNDSLAPVIGFVKQDIEHMINTLHWK